MKCMADLCVMPIGEGVSIIDEVAECERILSRFSIETHLHAFGTTLYGEMEDVFNAIQACHKELHDKGVTRLQSSVRIGTRTDKEQTPAEQTEVVEQRLASVG